MAGPGRHGLPVWRLFMMLPLLLFFLRRPPTRPPPPDIDRVVDTSGNIKYQVTLDEKTGSQAYGGSVRFAIAGLDIQNNLSGVTACFRWKQAGGPFKRCVTPVRIGETADPRISQESFSP